MWLMLRSHSMWEMLRRLTSFTLSKEIPQLEHKCLPLLYQPIAIDSMLLGTDPLNEPKTSRSLLISAHLSTDTITVILALIISN